MEGHARSLLGCDAKFRIAVHASQLVIDVETDGNTSLPTLRNFAADTVRPLVDLISYRAGGGFEVQIISATNKETNEWAVFGPEIPILAQVMYMHKSFWRIFEPQCGCLWKRVFIATALSKR